MPQPTTTRLLLPVLLLLTAAATRLLPHPPNLTPLAAMALFGAAYLRPRALAVIIPMAALYLSDLVLNNVVYGAYYPTFHWGGNLFVYGGFLLIALLGFVLLRGRVTWLRVGGAALFSSVLFFALTNFGVWAADPFQMYPDNAAGLLLAYSAGLPFFLNTLAGDLLFSGLLFGGYALVTRGSLQLQARTVRA